MGERYDLAIVGAGTAGAAAALFAAQAGMSVACLDAKPLDQAGARWVNGVPRWAFDAAGLAPPRPPELRGEGAPFHMIAGWGPDRITLRADELMEVDMRGLVARLQDAARGAGASLFGGRRVKELADGVLQTSAGPIAARWFVDASGLGGAGLLKRAKPAPEAICAAAQQVRSVTDLQAAQAWFRGHGVPPGETLCFTGIAGGYSILNVQLHGEALSILTGSIPALGHASGARIAKRFVDEHGWVGELVFGGSRPIPLQAPWDALAEGPVALLGDAAGQVFSAHGSGIAAGLLAARLLADTLAGGGSPWDYNVAWQRRHGGAFAGTAAFTRFTAALDTAAVSRLLRSGLVPPSVSAQILAQRDPAPHPRDLPNLIRGIKREPGFAARFTPLLAQIGLLRAHYARYPRRPERLAGWAKRRDRILGGA